MPDLALLITQVLLASKTLFGPVPSELLDPVPYLDFIKAMLNELDSLIADLDRDTRNVLLTFARIWSSVETDSIRSKIDAASWVINKLPDEYKPVMNRARAISSGEEKKHWEDLKVIIKSCAEFMVEHIKIQTSGLNSSDYSNRSIKVA